MTDQKRPPNCGTGHCSCLECHFPPASSTLPERAPDKPAEEQGLFRKFDVARVDGSDAPGGKHHGCEYFVLDVTHDQHAKAALQAYAVACEQTHPELSNDLRQRHGWNHDKLTIKALQTRVGQLKGQLLGQTTPPLRADFLPPALHEGAMWHTPGDFTVHISGLTIRKIQEIFEDKYHGSMMWSEGAAYPADDVSIKFASYATTPQASEPAPGPMTDAELAILTERGAKAWAGVNAQALRDGEPAPSTTGEDGQLLKQFLSAAKDAGITHWPTQPAQGERAELAAYLRRMAFEATGIKNNTDHPFCRAAALLQSPSDHIPDAGKMVVDGFDLGELYATLHSISKGLEGSDSFHADQVPGCYGAVLDLMRLVKGLQNGSQPPQIAAPMPLAVEQIEPLWRRHCHAMGPIAVQDLNFARAIEAAHGIGAQK